MYDRPPMSIDDLRIAMHKITPAGTMAALFYEQWRKAHRNYRAQESTSSEERLASSNAMTVLQSAMLAEHLDPEPLCGEITTAARCARPIDHDGEHLMRPYFLPT